MTDWTIAINYTGGGLNKPQTIAADASGNVYITNPGNSTLTELSNAGAVLIDGYYGGDYSGTWGVAIDQLGNYWVTNPGSNSVHRGGPSGDVVYPSGWSLSQPKGITIDGNGTAWIASTGNNSLVAIPAAGMSGGYPGSPFTGGGIDAPTSVAIDSK